MCNGTWVCFACRIALRRPTWRLITYLRPWLIGDSMGGQVRCPGCHESCQFLGPTIEIPPKRDVAAWERLGGRVAKIHAQEVDGLFKRSVRSGHELEKRIRDLENRPRNPGRDALIEQLRAELTAVG